MPKFAIATHCIGDEITLVERSGPDAVTVVKKYIIEEMLPDVETEDEDGDWQNASSIDEIKEHLNDNYDIDLVVLEISSEPPAA